jgi:site-specific DNA recombinase
MTGSRGEVRFFKVTRMLQRKVYAGYVEAPQWGVSLRKGHHEPLIDLETFERIQHFMNEGARPAARKDFTEDFSSCVAGSTATNAARP